jgi:N-acetylglucosamine-6-phosphate deacetylase
MDEAVRNAIRFLNVSLAQAVRMAAETPAAALNLDGKGKTTVGCDADFVLPDEEGTVLQTIVAGELATSWKRGDPLETRSWPAARSF